VEEELSEREMLGAILGSVQYAHVKLDQILDIFGDDAKRKKTKLTAEFWRRDAELRAEVDRMLAILKREREQKQQAAG
jgi:hypothetical protein